MQERVQLPESLEYALQDAKDVPPDHELATAKARTWQQVVERGRRARRLERLRPWVTGVAVAVCAVLVMLVWQRGDVLGKESTSQVPSATTTTDETDPVIKAAQTSGIILFEDPNGMKISWEGNGVFRKRGTKERILTVNPTDTVVLQASHDGYTLQVTSRDQMQKRLYYVDFQDHMTEIPLRGYFAQSLLYLDDEENTTLLLGYTNPNNKTYQIYKYEIKSGRETLMHEESYVEIPKLSLWLWKDSFLIESSYKITLYDHGKFQKIDESATPVISWLRVLSNDIVYSKGPQYKWGGTNTRYEGARQVWLYEVSTGRKGMLLPDVDGEQSYLGNLYGEQDDVHLVNSFVPTGEILQGQAAEEQTGIESIYRVRLGEQPKLLFQKKTIWRFREVILFKSQNGEWQLNGEYGSPTRYYDPSSDTIYENPKK